MTAEKLAMLAPRTVEIGRIGGGGIPDLTGMDIAGALGMGDAFGGELLMAKYAGDERAAHSAKIRWRMRVGDYSIAQGWDRGKPGTTFRMADYALFEWISPSRCGTCSGVAEVMVGQVKRQCSACSGTGLFTPSDRNISKTLGVSMADYKARWVVRLAWARKELHRTEYETLAALEQALEDE